MATSYGIVGLTVGHLRGDIDTSTQTLWFIEGITSKHQYIGTQIAADLLDNI